MNKIQITKKQIARPEFRSMWNGQDYYENVTTAEIKEILFIETFGGGWDKIRTKRIGLFRDWLISEKANIRDEDFLKYISTYAKIGDRYYFGNVKTIMKNLNIPERYYNSIYKNLWLYGEFKQGDITFFRTKTDK